MHSVNFQNMKNPKYALCREFNFNTSCESDYDDITMTSFINIKYGDVAVEKNPVRNSVLLFVFCGQKDLAQI